VTFSAFISNPGLAALRGSNLETSASFFGATTGIGKNHAQTANAKALGFTLISQSMTHGRWLTEHGKLVIESFRNQENMVGVPKHLSLTPTVTFGHLSLRQSEHHRDPLRRQFGTKVS